MGQQLTITQRQRLIELNAENNMIDREFENAEDRNKFYRNVETQLVKENKDKITKLLHFDHKPLALQIENRIDKWLIEKEGFTRVVTPTIITAGMLEKMTITKEHPLTNQVFWLDSKRCLRPMLAPNLYEVMRDLHKITKEPVRIFESGSCFRKESQGAQHLNEFTMLNFVELAGVQVGEQMDRLKELSKSAMQAIGIDHYEMVIEKSEVYGETLDIVVDDLELASGSYGPHVLDSKWGVFDTWVGIGFGIERIAMILGKYQTIKRVGKSITYIDGALLNL